MAINLDSIVKDLSGLTVLELNELRKKLEEHWDVKAAVQGAVMAVAPAGYGAAQADVEQKTEFDVELVAISPEKKLNMIKLIRELNPGLGLADAKKVVESLPKKIKEAVSKKEADEVEAKLKEAGATTVVVK